MTSIAIAGGGLAGATAALILARALPDTEVTLFDPAGALAPAEGAPLDLRTTALAPGTAELLGALDIWRYIEPAPLPLSGISVRDSGHAGRLELTEADNAGAPLGYVAGNQALDRALHVALGASGVRLERQAVDRFIPGPDAMVLEVGGQTRPFQLGIIADGAHSRLREGLGIAVERVDYRQVALVVNARFARPHEARAWELFTRHGPLALLPLGTDPQLRAVIWTLPRGARRRFESLDEATLRAELHKASGGRAGACLEVGQRAFYPLERVIARELVRARLALLGNAAHFLHPVAGQGLNLALRGALRLAQALRDADAPVGDLAALQRFADSHAGDVWRTQSLGHGFVKLFARGGGLWPAARAAGFAALGWEPLRAEFLTQLGGRAEPKVRL